MEAAFEFIQSYHYHFCLCSQFSCFFLFPSAGLFWNFVKMWSWPILTRESLSSFFWVSIYRNISSFLGLFVEYATKFFLGHCGNTLIVATRSLCTIRAKDGALSSAVVRLILRLFECFHRCDSYSLPRDIRTASQPASRKRASESLSGDE